MGNGGFILTLWLSFWNCNQADCCPATAFIVIAISVAMLYALLPSQRVLSDRFPTTPAPHSSMDQVLPQHREDKAKIKVRLGDIFHLQSHQFFLPELSLKCHLYIQYQTATQNLYHPSILQQGYSIGGQGKSTWWHLPGLVQSIWHCPTQHPCLWIGDKWIWWMDHSADKELAGWSHSKCCSQQLNVQVETSDERHSSGVSIGTSAV